MADQTARRDQNYVPVAQGVDDTTGETRSFLADAQGRLKVTAIISGLGAGNVVGPSSSTDNAIARFDGTTGELLQDSAVLIADTTGNISGMQKITVGVVGSATGSVEIKGTTSGTVTLKTADAAGTYTLTLPTSDGDANQVLTTDGSGVLSWTSNGAGDVVGPASATDNAIARYDSTTGKLIQNSVVTIADTTGDMAGVGTLNTHTIPGGTGTLALTSQITGTNSGVNTGDQTITLTGDVTGSGTGTFAATIANDAVTYAKMQNVSATDKVLGRSTAGAGDVEEITMTAAGRALMDDANAAAQRTTLGLGTIATQDANNVTITGGSISGVAITGITDLTVPDGGTGASTFTDGGVLIGNGAGAIQATSAGTAGQVLTSNGAGVDPTFQSLSSLVGANSGFSLTAIIPTPQKIAITTGRVGYSYEGKDIITIGGYDNASGGGQMYSKFQVATDFGVSLYSVAGDFNSVNAIIANTLHADSHFWTALVAGNTTAYQDGVSVTFGSQACSGAMSWDDGNSYLLFLNTTTNIRRFTYAATTLTFVDNITLDNAVTIDLGFVFDDTNNNYYFLDTAADVIRKFNSSGTQQSATAYTIDDSRAIGVVAVNGRIYIAVGAGGASNDNSGVSDISAVAVNLIPTTVTL